MSESELSVIAGLPRFAFHPALAAGGAWLIVTGVRPDSLSLDRFLSSAISKKLPSGFAKKFARFRPVTGTARKSMEAAAATLAEDALVEAGSLLRSVLLANRADERFRDDDDFYSDPVYSRAADLLESLRTQVDQLGERNLSKCPNCGLVGDLNGWFGVRIMKKKGVPQSWCRICRSSGSGESLSESTAPTR
jgi:hypothetical protein